MTSLLPAVLRTLPDPSTGTGDDTEPPAPGGLADLAQRLGYAFRKPALLRVALTLGSWINEHAGAGWPSNACLEFFGDAVLDLVVADYLWRRFPRVEEGALTRLRASLVAESGLLEVARSLDLGASLYLGRGDARSGGRDHRGNLADALEAIFGAIFLDARDVGDDALAISAAVFERLFAPALLHLDPSGARDPKSRLQEWAQGRYRITPAYVRVGDVPPAQDARWRARVELRFSDTDILVLGEGDGATLREAERMAARQALDAHGGEVDDLGS